jgi:uncharacterized protein YbjT (DUF2867 family)
MGNRTAIVFGATGMIGTYLVEELIQNMRYSAIKVFSRRKLNIEHIKVIEHIVDVEDVNSYKELIRGDDLFICLGTTMKKAGSIKRYKELDGDMPVNIAKASHESGIKRVAVVSALGAGIRAKSYFNRIKGEMEEGIRKIGFESTIIARPSLLLGKRGEFRLFEKIATVFAKLFSFVLFGKLEIYKAIHGRDVAIAMIEILAGKTGKKIYLSHELKHIADKKANTNNETNK